MKFAATNDRRVSLDAFIQDNGKWSWMVNGVIGSSGVDDAGYTMVSNVIRGEWRLTEASHEEASELVRVVFRDPEHTSRLWGPR